ncbi:M1 family aminopeptidase [uncultured Roseibium sp.]|uniref:M1 family metallopeptidase n=1 Tax=uncultured Roseibium sp. TaxID=1936171 RepID=UPI0026201B75|nr:M1 family aminopeptidase [uncultured Roseibium sp.]
MMRGGVRVAFAVACGVASVSLSMAAERTVHYNVRLDVDPEARVIEVQNRITVNGTDSLALRFADWLDVEEVAVDGAPANLDRRRGGGVVSLPRADRQIVSLTLSGDIPEIMTSGPDGAVLFGNSGWFPIAQAEELSYELRVTVPHPYQAVSSGRLSEETETASSFSATFIANFALEPPSVFIGPYSVAERDKSEIRLRTYFHEDIHEFSDQYLAKSEAYLNRFSTEIGRYPYQDFHVVSSPLPVGLGFVNLAYVGRMIVPLPFMQGRSLAHEVLHNWWGNGVFVDYREGNWAEGLTTYMADYALAADEGPEAAIQMRLDWLRDFAALPPERDMPVIEFRSKRHDASQIVGYNKVAFLFHMLKGEIGDEVFAGSLQKFWTDHKFSHADWSDLRHSFEAVSGRDLGWFFNQWLERKGAPEIQLSMAKVQRGSSAYVSEFTIRQTGSIYSLNIPIEIETKDGLVNENVRLSEREQTFEIQSDTKPLRLSVDPAFDVFRRLLPGESPAIIRDVTLEPAVDVLLLSEQGTFAEAAQRLLARLLGNDTVATPISEHEKIEKTTVVLGRSAAIKEFAEENGLKLPPLDDTGNTAAAWVTRLEKDLPVMLISARDGDALSALVRSLPHYGRQSYVSYAGNKAIERGTWPIETNPLEITFPH